MLGARLAEQHAAAGRVGLRGAPPHGLGRDRQPRQGPPRRHRPRDALVGRRQRRADSGGRAVGRAGGGRAGPRGGAGGVAVPEERRGQGGARLQGGGQGDARAPPRARAPRRCRVGGLAQERRAAAAARGGQRAGGAHRRVRDGAAVPGLGLLEGQLAHSRPTARRAPSRRRGRWRRAGVRGGVRAGARGARRRAHRRGGGGGERRGRGDHPRRPAGRVRVGGVRPEPHAPPRADGPPHRRGGSRPAALRRRALQRVAGADAVAWRRAGGARDLPLGPGRRPRPRRLALRRGVPVRQARRNLPRRGRGLRVARALRLEPTPARLPRGTACRLPPLPHARRAARLPVRPRPLVHLVRVRAALAVRERDRYLRPSRRVGPHPHARDSQRGQLRRQRGRAAVRRLQPQEWRRPSAGARAARLSQGVAASRRVQDGAAGPRCARLCILRHARRRLARRGRGVRARGERLLRGRAVARRRVGVLRGRGGTARGRRRRQPALRRGDRRGAGPDGAAGAAGAVGAAL
mmetsp:Transcript_7276/g.24019  ORF Transcript_7276/g.24019 Transcript_7276/m.24019 type:complete len:520 (+) Transcript_7276:675-2234(+)